MSGAKLFLHQELLLLALNDELGTTERGAWLPLALATGALADLLIAGRIRIPAPKADAKVAVVDRTPLGDAFLDDCLRRIAGDAKARSVQSWAHRISSAKQLRALATRELVERGILRTDTKKVLWIFDRDVYPARDPEPEREIRARLRTALLRPGRPVVARTLVLIALAERTGVLKPVLTRQERRDSRARVKDVLAGRVPPGDDPSGAGAAASAAAKALVEQAITAVIIAGVVVPVVSS